MRPGSACNFLHYTIDRLPWLLHSFPYIEGQTFPVCAGDGRKPRFPYGLQDSSAGRRKRNRGVFGNPRRAGLHQTRAARSFTRYFRKAVTTSRSAGSQSTPSSSSKESHFFASCSSKVGSPFSTLQIKHSMERWKMG